MDSASLCTSCVVLVLLVGCSGGSQSPEPSNSVDRASSRPQVSHVPTRRGPPDGYEQILSRNALPAIDGPTFVAAGDAAIADDAWILGVEVGGTARAYSLWLLNRHEIVNDRFGSKPVAVVW